MSRLLALVFPRERWLVLLRSIPLAWHWLRSHKAHLAFYALAGAAVEKLLTGHALSVIVLQLALYCLYDAVFPRKDAPCPCNANGSDPASSSKAPPSPTS